MHIFQPGVFIRPSILSAGTVTLAFASMVAGNMVGNVPRLLINRGEALPAAAAAAAAVTNNKHIMTTANTP